MDKIIDQETLRGWIEASKKDDINYAIHPSGSSISMYNISGALDAERVMKYVGDNDIVMDYGCGNGRVLQYIPNEKVGIDVASYDEWVIHPDKFEGKVDLIYSISVFIHNTQETGANILKWMKSHLNPGGRLLVQIPIYDKHKDPLNWTDVGVWTEKQFREAVESAGLEIVEMHTNPGEFSFEQIGDNHGKFQVLK